MSSYYEKHQDYAIPEICIKGLGKDLESLTEAYRAKGAEVHFDKSKKITQIKLPFSLERMEEILYYHTDIEEDPIQQVHNDPRKDTVRSIIAESITNKRFVDAASFKFIVDFVIEHELSFDEDFKKMLEIWELVEDDCKIDTLDVYRISTNNKDYVFLDIVRTNAFREFFRKRLKETFNENVDSFEKRLMAFNLLPLKKSIELLMKDFETEIEGYVLFSKEEPLIHDSIGIFAFDSLEQAMPYYSMFNEGKFDDISIRKAKFSSSLGCHVVDKVEIAGKNE